MPRSGRKFNAKDYMASLKMLQEVARRRAEMDAQFPLFFADKDEIGEEETTPAERTLVEEHTLKRNWMHFEKGYPWGELPTAATRLRKHRELEADPFWRAMMSAQ